MSTTNIDTRRTIDDPEMPEELRLAIREFWEESEWDNAAAISWLESRWNAFALADTVDHNHPCGTVIATRGGIQIAAERSVGYFQINSCNFPGWEWQRLYNARHNAGTAHLLWDRANQSWAPWYFSAVQLGLIHA
jgi:hypothetical protein